MLRWSGELLQGPAEGWAGFSEPHTAIRAPARCLRPKPRPSDGPRTAPCVGPVLKGKIGYFPTKSSFGLK